MEVQSQKATVSVAPIDVLVGAQRVAAFACARAGLRDADESAPDEEIAALAAEGLLHAPLPHCHSGQALGAAPETTALLRNVLRVLGGASLPLWRLYEGHVNALRLVMRYGTFEQLAVLRCEADAGRMSAVWNAEAGEGLRLMNGKLQTSQLATNEFQGRQLQGSKIFASGAGMVRRPLVTAKSAYGVVMVLANAQDAPVDLAAWTPLGMRASLTGKIDFSNIAVSDREIIGAVGDYYWAPLFAGGAWRVLAVQLGGLERLVSLYRTQMHTRGCINDSVQRARFGQTVASLEAARLWSARAATLAEDTELPHDEIDAFVNLARHGFEAAALGIIENIERGVGLGAMLQPSPIERIIRDLKTYLRQPFPDAALDVAAVWALAERPMHGDIGALG